MDDYKGSGTPDLYTTRQKITAWKLIKDANENYMFKNVDELKNFLGVNALVEVDVMKGVQRTVEATDYDLLAIVVNPRDYTSGANKGGQVSVFDGFDIDYNQFKYLIETRCSGALTKLYSAVVVEKAVAAG